MVRHACRNIRPKEPKSKFRVCLSHKPKLTLTSLEILRSKHDHLLMSIIAEVSRAMNFGEFVGGKSQQPLPEILSSREADLNAFQDYCQNLMLKILTLFAVGLNVSNYPRNLQL